MTVILAFDQSITRTGWAAFEPPAHSTMVLGSFTSAPRKAMRTEEKCGLFCDEVEKLFKRFRPNFVVWEQANEVIRSYPKKAKKDLVGATVSTVTVNADQLILRDIQGHIRHAARARHLPYACVAPTTWHATILGNGNITRDAAKPAAMVFCQRLRLAPGNHDEAEAACIALWAQTCDVYRMLKYKAQLAKADAA